MAQIEWFSTVLDWRIAQLVLPFMCNASMHESSRRWALPCELLSKASNDGCNGVWNALGNTLNIWSDCWYSGCTPTEPDIPTTPKKKECYTLCSCLIAQGAISTSPGVSWKHWPQFRTPLVPHGLHARRQTAKNDEATELLLLHAASPHLTRGEPISIQTGHIHCLCTKLAALIGNEGEWPEMAWKNVPDLLLDTKYFYMNKTHSTNANRARHAN